jgi:formylglycine-generating enzyme required for sulfatase activity
MRMVTPAPDAFLSYTRFDDLHDGGAISEFRLRLISAVRAVTGRTFEIFQDIDGIGLGEKWSGKLDQILDQARFFIPIITPNYFTSEACRDELEKFLRAEAERGRSDLVLPIYYIECDVLEDPDLRRADPLATVIHERQRQDWRALRFEPIDAKDVRMARERLAREIVRARGRAMPQASPEPVGEEPHDRSEGLPEPGTVFRDIDAPWCPELTVIAPGTFMMGSPAHEEGRSGDEGPQHQVSIGYPFAAGRYPVTFEEFDRFVAETARKRPGDRGWGRGHRPVVNVSWQDAKGFVSWLSRETGHTYRLLSEAEWEYAARAGTITRFSWGDDIPTAERANFGSNRGRTTEVGSYPANPWGLCDMHGNVREWVEDCWNDSYEGAPDNGSAWTSGDCARRVLRGGSWYSVPRLLRSAFRYWLDSVDRDGGIGFRVARTLR